MIIAKNLVQERLNGITPHGNCTGDQPVIKSGATECVIFIAWYFFEEVFELLTSRDIQTLQAGCVRQLMSWNEDQCMQSGSIRTGAPGGTFHRGLSKDNLNIRLPIILGQISDRRWIMPRNRQGYRDIGAFFCQ